MNPRELKKEFRIHRRSVSQLIEEMGNKIDAFHVKTFYLLVT
jgi:hypothetical protein